MDIAFSSALQTVYGDIEGSIEFRDSCSAKKLEISELV